MFTREAQPAASREVSRINPEIRNRGVPVLVTPAEEFLPSVDRIFFLFFSSHSRAREKCYERDWHLDKSAMVGTVNFRATKRMIMVYRVFRNWWQVVRQIYVLSVFVYGIQ